jgi:hypothetical protein
MLHSQDGFIFQSGREISKNELNQIQETVCSFPNLSLSELAATICEHLEWFTASGGYKLDACMKLLEKLEATDFIRLPARREQYQGNRAQKPIPLTNRTDPGADINCTLKHLAPVRVEVVNGREKTALWNEYVLRYHYLGYKRPFGYFLRYFVVHDQTLLGCILFSGASKSLKLRDKWIGWTERQRLKNLAWVINNSRFLIFPWVHVKNLASHVLGKALTHIKDDWLRHWGYSPFLAETFVDPVHYQGSCYKAANWQYLGMTTGEGLVRKGKSYHTTPKMIFLRPLTTDFRSLLCSDQLKGRVEQ